MLEQCRPKGGTIFKKRTEKFTIGTTSIAIKVEAVWTKALSKNFFWKFLEK